MKSISVKSTDIEIPFSFADRDLVLIVEEYDFKPAEPMYPDCPASPEEIEVTDGYVIPDMDETPDWEVGTIEILDGQTAWEKACEILGEKVSEAIRSHREYYERQRF